MQILMGKLRNKNESLNKDLLRQQDENDKLVDQKKDVEESLKAITLEIGKFQMENIELPQKITNLDNHLSITKQEKRRIDIEYRLLLEI
jgi:septal ring factor EnvC (AmiA/AmiB activator)